MTKLYKFDMKQDRLSQKFTETHSVAAAEAGGAIWMSLNFDNRDLPSLVMMDLPDDKDPSTVAPLPGDAAWETAI